ncbi:NUDIX hydrolase [Halobellus clavatus]|uniref:ADP-ribose pyrophosphatase n=1 Tax=Halobellus clavatus TaxID=660517 RepID=A0A1H3HYP5_9EURY|nr:NUDIX hydrolase [Halobellus clavatus]SDY20610.1 ADP-ribose pyrophosphatase [Halobellus clavatus]
MTDEWPVLDSEIEYANPYFAVEREAVEQPDGTPNDYYRIDFDAAGGVIALGVDDGDVLFVELYRPRLQRRLLELPGGGIDDGETPEAAARREFAEETGFEPSTTTHLGSFYFSAWTRAQRDVVWVDDFSPAPAHETEPEVQDIKRVPVADALNRVCDDPAAEWNLTPLILAQREGFIEGL